MAIISLVAPMMVYLDRFMVSALLSVAMVAYYTAPFDVLLRLTVIPGGVAGVLFPAFAVSLAQDRDRTALPEIVKPRHEENSLIVPLDVQIHSCTSLRGQADGRLQGRAAPDGHQPLPRVAPR